MMYSMHITMWVLAVAGYGFAAYLVLRRRFAAAERREKWASLSGWTAGAGADNWHMAAHRLIVLTLASVPVWIGAVYFWNQTSVGGQLFFVMANAVPASIVLLDWAGAKAAKTSPERLGVLRAAATAAVVLYALLLAVALWYVHTTASPAGVKRPRGNLWEFTNRLATAVRQEPGYNLRTIEAHVTAMFLSPSTAYELYEIGEQKGVFPFRKRSYAGLQRWYALDDLLTALVEHARAAAKRGDWQRCNEALQIALLIMREAAELEVPDDLRPRLDTRMVPVQSFALIHVRQGFERIYPLLKEIAFQSPAHKHHIEHALQQGRQVEKELVQVRRKGRPLMRAQLQRAQHQQLEAIFEEALHRLSLELLRWGYSIEDGLSPISVAERKASAR